jgi:hypothetical protein
MGVDLMGEIVYTVSCLGYINCADFLFRQLNTLWVMIPPFTGSVRADVT